METIYKVLDDCEVKKLEDRTYEFTASTATQDRDGEVIDVHGWDLKNFKKNPVIMYAHDYRNLPIGKAPRVWVSNDGKLKNTVEFPPEGTYEFADIVERLVNTGYLKTESVGFIPKKWEDGDGEKAPRRTYTKQELLEISLVPVPSNPDALRNAVNDGVITTKEYEAITKPEETDDFIRIPVRDCKVTATIDISKKEGISALYCGKEKQVRTYLFDKRPPYNWTMARAKKWVEEHKQLEESTCYTNTAIAIDDDILTASDSELEDIEIELKGAIPYKKTPLADEGADWDAGKEVRQAEVDDLKIMCAWVGEDPENKTSYKLPHHRASGSHECVWRAVAAAGAAIMGARGGVAIPSGDVGGVKSHLAKHYREFDKEPPWEKGITQAELKDEMDYLNNMINEVGIGEESSELAWDLVKEIMRLHGDDIPFDITEKVGAVLSAKNKDRLKQAQNLIQQVIDSAREEPPEPDKEDDDKAITQEMVIKIVQNAVSEAIAKAQGKV